jgi:hypothetical protein
MPGSLGEGVRVPQPHRDFHARQSEIAQQEKSED